MTIRSKIPVILMSNKRLVVSNNTNSTATAISTTTKTTTMMMTATKSETTSLGTTQGRLSSSSQYYSSLGQQKVYSVALQEWIGTKQKQQQQQQQQKLDVTSSRRRFASVGVVSSSSPSFSSNEVIAPTGAYNQVVDKFPSLIIRGSSDNTNDDSGSTITAIGSFAEAQAMYLNPDPVAVEQLVQMLQQTNAGIVAHYYMDVELQGVLQAANTILPGRIGIADSLRMGDMAVTMIQNLNVSSILCLGVDFMSESVAAILHQNSYSHIPVYRATTSKIGCSLAESAERDTYRAWLQQESTTSTDAIHVIYINTSLETKAVSNSIVPTITCTSSNVLQTILQISNEMPTTKILYGPDTYMGENLITLLRTILNDSTWTDEKICQQLHPLHTRTTVQQLYNNIRVYPYGNCIVHHMFGTAVVDTVRSQYCTVDNKDTYITAHLEVPGEMFQIAMDMSLTDTGVVGSTSDILNFITRKVQEKIDTISTSTTTPVPSSLQPIRLKFILGTEAGMVTSIVRNVQVLLQKQQKQQQQQQVEVEIIFPVAADAVHATDDGQLVPGVTGGEGCSTAGGCATCPFMKMNNLDAVIDVLTMIQNNNNNNNNDNNNNNKLLLTKHLPPNKLQGAKINGINAIDLGTEPIMYMRYLSTNKVLPTDLVQRVQQQKH